MQTSIDRRRKLPAFRADLAEAEVLWDRLTAQFDEHAGHLYRRFDVELRGKKLSFEKWSEVAAHQGFPDRLQRFSFYMSQGRRTVVVRSEGFISSSPYATATSESEGWCASALEEAYAFASARRVWSWWVSGLHLQIFVWLCSVCTGALLVSGTLTYLTRSGPSSLIFLAWSLLLIAWWVLGLFHQPRGQFVVRNRDGFLKRNAWAIGLLFTAVGAVASVIAVFRK